VTIDWSATDDAGLTQVELFYQYNGGGYASWADATNPAAATGTADSGSWSFNFPDGAGTYDFYTIATDNVPQTEGAPGSPDVTIDYVLKYNIPISGTGWQLVSFPITATGDILTVFDDATWGDGGTTWTMMQWYNGSDGTDHWKTYYSHIPGMADLSTVNNNMGVWIFIETNGGDGLLSCGSGYEPSGTRTITLYPGWNLVGYPAVDDSTYTVGNLKTDTGATIVEGYLNSPGPPDYNVQVLLDSYVLTRGEAYWVYIDGGASVPWDITW
jgi:hypothetical protein